MAYVYESFQHWSDSDHASNKVVANKRKSQTGIISVINGVPHVYKSAAQPVVALSSTLERCRRNLIC